MCHPNWGQNDIFHFIVVKHLPKLAFFNFQQINPSKLEAVTNFCKFLPEQNILHILSFHTLSRIKII